MSSPRTYDEEPKFVTVATIEQLVSDKVTEAIRPAMEPEGPLYASVLNWLRDSVATGGVVAQAVEAGKGKKATGPPGAANSWKAKAEKTYPFREHLHKMTVGEYAQAWRKITVDTDSLELMVDAMEESGTAHIMGLSAAYPQNTSLTKLKENAAIKHAPRTSRKPPCLPS